MYDISYILPFKRKHLHNALENNIIYNKFLCNNITNKYIPTVIFLKIKRDLNESQTL